ncbi:MAG: DUF4402 domain-containing protein [Bacteroidales bacterium]
MKTNRTLKLITLTAAIFGFAATSFGQISSDQADAGVGATIIAPITVSQAHDLEFGYIVKTTTANIVTVTAAGARSATVTESLLTSQTGDPSAAEFEVTGEDDFTYKVTLPTTITLEGDGGVDMTVDNFVTNLTNNIGTIGTNDTFTVGANLNVNANQGVGLYTGEFQVTVAYE